MTGVTDELTYVNLTADMAEQCAALELAAFPHADPAELLSVDDIRAYAETFPEGFFLAPAPADLAWLAGAPKDKADPYIYWSIAEGGQAFASEMPAFKQTLSRQEIWALATYLRAGMPYASP